MISSFSALANVFRPLAVAVAGALLLAGCGISDESFVKGDTKPHPGVAAARRLPVHGVDVSRYQGAIDWSALKASGTHFAYIKATEGGDFIDPNFLTNWNGARAAGVPRGAYHFVYWCRPAHEQAQWFVQHIPNDPDALPPVLDLEWNGHSRTCPQKVEKQLALEKIRLMLGELERHTGKRPIIYTDITFHKDVLEGESEFDRYPFWLRSVAAEPQERYHARRWMLWQYTTTGRIGGVRGDVDRNAFYGSEREWASFLSTDCDPRDHHLQDMGRRCGGRSDRQAYAPGPGSAAVAGLTAAPAEPALAKPIPNSAPVLQPVLTQQPAPGAPPPLVEPTQTLDSPGADPVPLDEEPATTSSLPSRPTTAALLPPQRPTVSLPGAKPLSSAKPRS